MEKRGFSERLLSFTTREVIGLLINSYEKESQGEEERG